MTTPSLTSFLHPTTGFHSTSTTTILIPNPSTFSNCSLHLHFRLPPDIFVDRYELENYRDAFAFKHWGTENLELPVTAVSYEGSAVLLDVAWPSGKAGNMNATVAVPLHARYGEVSQTDVFREIIVEWPLAFFACPLPATGLSAATSFVPRIRPEFREYFDSDFINFFDILPTSKHAHDTLRLPIGNLSHLVTVQLGTALCIIGLFFYVSYVSYMTWRRLELMPRRKEE